MKAVIDGATHQLRSPLGEGGEAFVYPLGKDRVVKMYKAPPDTKKLSAFLRAPFPGCVVAPQTAAFDEQGALAGYVMPLVKGESLAAFLTPARPCDRLALLRYLYADLAAIHRAGIVVGDFNDANVLVTAAGIPRWIDADSYAIPGFPCTVFTERYTDPRILGTTAFDAQSDLYAFCTIALELLTYTHPYAGTHKLSHRERVAQRLTVFSPSVKRPKALPPLEVLPEPLYDHLRDVFAGKASGFPALLLDRLRLQRCQACGLEHGRPVCPHCAIVVQVPRGHGVRVTIRPFVPATLPRVQAHDNAIFVDGREIGRIIDGRTHVFSGARFGLAVMRVGELTIGATFDLQKKGLADNLRFPAIRGRVRELYCVFSDDHAWLMYEREEAGKRLSGCYLVNDRGEHVAEYEAETVEWLTVLGGQCAAGSMLFAPTDGGIVRIDARNGALVRVATFPQTAELVSAHSLLLCTNDGLGVVDATTRTVRVISLKETP